MTHHGVIMNQMPIFTSDSVYTGLTWIVAALLTRVEPLWHEIATNIEFHTSQWHGWMLVYLTKHCFNEGKHRQSKHDPFKLLYMNTIDRFVEKVLFQECLFCLSNRIGESKEWW